MLTREEILGDLPLPIFLLKCKNDFKFFCENCLIETSSGEKIKIYPFQLKWKDVVEKKKRVIIESGTGSSKTETMGAMYVLWEMFRKNNLNILLISKTMDQSSSNLLSRIKRYIENNEFLTGFFMPEDRTRSWNATEIQTKNSCWVKNVPFSDHIRGFRAHIIICDEIDSYEQPNIFFEHVLSRLFPTGKLIGISTPVGPTRIIGLLKEKEKAGLLSGWEFIKTPYLVDEEGNPAKITNREDIMKYISIWPENWSLQKLYDRWGEQGKSNWLRNYMCFKKETKIQTIDGMKNIEDIRINDLVLTHKGRYRKVINTFINKHEGKGIIIKQYGDNAPIVCTKEHPFLVVDSKRKRKNIQSRWYREFSEPYWIEANKIIKGKHYLLMPKIKDNFDKKDINLDMARIIGWYLAEGSIGSKLSTIAFDLNFNEKEYSKIIYDSLINISKNIPRITNTRTTLRVTINDRKLVTFLINNFGKTKTKRIPPWIFSENKEIREEILNNYLLGDGCEVDNGFSSLTVSSKLNTDIANLSISVGNITFKKTYKRKDKCVIENRIVNQSPEVYTTTHSKIEHHGKKVGDYIAYGVINISEIDLNENVYNIEVEEDNSYVLGACAVHNCLSDGEIDDAIFPIEHIIRSFDYQLGFSDECSEECQYFIGVDLAISEGPKADSDAYVVIEKRNGQYIIKLIETYKGLDTIPKINRIEELYNTYFSGLGTYVIVDKSQIGVDVIGGLRARGITTLEGSFHSAGRKQLYRTLSNVLASKRLIIPRCPQKDDESVKYSEELRVQLSGFKRTKSIKTGQEMIDSQAAHDDIVAALALAISEAVLHEEMEMSPIFS
jgi:hypothetical protein